MDKRVILAVAGSGKTRFIVDSLDLKKRTLIVTYTNNNVRTLTQRIVRKFGFVPENIQIFSYFTFLHSFCFRPFLSQRTKARGINWDEPPKWTLKLPRSDTRFYMDGYSRLYHNRIAKLLHQNDAIGSVIERLEKYFDCICVDEVQDISGHDFNFLSLICPARIQFLLVGDYFQHTFATSRDGNVNQGLHDDYETYVKRLEAIGFTPDRDSLRKSYRCSPEVCRFVSDRLGVEIASHRDDQAKVVVIDDKRRSHEIFVDSSIVKLFFREHYNYPCFSENWGASKGQDHYKDVCVVLSDANFRLLKSGRLLDLSPTTRNKLYVACTRARNDLYFVRQSHIAKFQEGAGALLVA